MNNSNLEPVNFINNQYHIAGKSYKPGATFYESKDDRQIYAIDLTKPEQINSAKEKGLKEAQLKDVVLLFEKVIVLPTEVTNLNNIKYNAQQLNEKIIKHNEHKPNKLEQLFNKILGFFGFSSTY